MQLLPSYESVWRSLTPCSVSRYPRCLFKYLNTPFEPAQGDLSPPTSNSSISSSVTYKPQWGTQWYINLSEEFPKLFCLMPGRVLASYQPHWCWRRWERRRKRAEHRCNSVCLHRVGGVRGTADSSGWWLPTAGHPPGPTELQFAPIYSLLSPPHHWCTCSEGASLDDQQRTNVTDISEQHLSAALTWQSGQGFPHAQLLLNQYRALTCSWSDPAPSLNQKLFPQS